MGLQKCRKILPEFFGAITTDQFRGVAAAFKQGGLPVAKVRGSGTSCKHDSLTRRAVLKLAVTPPDHRRRHSSQREICKELGVSKGYVHRTIEKSNLKCFRRIKCHVLTEAHRQT